MKKTSEQRARAVTREMLSFRGWDIRQTSKGGQVLEESEYKNHESLNNLFKGKSKSGKGDGRPDFMLVDSSQSLQPLAIIETKAAAKQKHLAIQEAQFYADAIIETLNRGVLAIGVSGNDEEICSIIVTRKVGKKWLELTLHGQPIDWIPSPKQMASILSSNNLTEVSAEKPSDEVLTQQANRLNEILRECKIKDEFRPTYAATFMLALWKGDVSTDSDVVLSQINANAKLALQKAKKSALTTTLLVDEENKALATRAWEIVDILKKLNIRSFLHEHDYLGQLYETFFKYTGGNTIGQYFTPRHIIQFMCELTDVNPDDKVFDPACGTGGFLIGALNRMIKKKHLPYSEAINLIKDNLFGIESEPATAALCIVNMILRGDGRSGIIKDDCFENTNYGSGANVALMNPPFPHKKTDTPTTDFIDRAMESLGHKGLLASIVPYSLLLNTGDWHNSILKKNSLLMAATLPADLFSPYASYNTAVILLQKGVPHENGRVFFCRIENDGYRLKKNERIPQPGSQIDLMLDLYKSKKSIPQASIYCNVQNSSKEWAPEAYIESKHHDSKEFLDGLAESIRLQSAFYVRHGNKLTPSDPDDRLRIASPAAISTFSEPEDIKSIRIGDYFNVELGGNEEIEDLDDGNTPIVSTSEFMNGVTTWKSPPKLWGPQVITVATDGSTCSSFVQEFSFYAFYKVAILKPHKDIPVDALYYIAYLLRREKWRYVYARKFGKARISDTKISVPFNGEKPDFEYMASLVRSFATYEIIQKYRKSITGKK